MLWWGRKRKGEACLLTLRLLELNIRTLGRDIPWHFTPRRTKFHCRQSPKCKWMNRVRICNYWARKSQQRRVMWPLREGREIWGVDGTFASISWRRDCVRDGVAPSANELAWFYRVSDIVTQEAFPKREVHAALSYLWKRTSSWNMGSKRAKGPIL